MIKPTCLVGVAAAVIALLAPARADDPGRGLALADKRGCLECHAVGWTNVGPGFADIATRYRYQADTREMLVDKIRFGGTQHWGERFNMWPQTNVTDDEVYELVDWILAQ